MIPTAVAPDAARGEEVVIAKAGQPKARLGIQALPVGPEHAEATLRLPSPHRDPFDRLLSAQAGIEGLTLVTHDPLVRSYPGVMFLPA